MLIVYFQDIEFSKKISDLFDLLDIQNLIDTLILELFGFIKIISKDIGVWFLMFYYYFKLSCFLVIILPIILYVAHIRHKQTMKEQKNIRWQKYISYNIVLEGLENIKSIEAFTTEGEEKHQYEIQLKEMWNETYKFLIKSIVNWNIIGIFFLSVILLIIKLGTYFIKKIGEKKEDLTNNLFRFITLMVFNKIFNGIT